MAYIRHDHSAFHEDLRRRLHQNMLRNNETAPTAPPKTNDPMTGGYSPAPPQAPMSPVPQMSPAMLPQQGLPPQMQGQRPPIHMQPGYQSMLPGNATWGTRPAQQSSTPVLDMIRNGLMSLKVF